MNRLHKYLPSYYKKSEMFKEITRVESDEFDRLDLDVEDLSKQFVVDTATWGLAIYEKELGLPIKPNKTLDERRSIAKAKMRGVDKVDWLMIKAIVEAFTNNEVTIGFDSRILIEFRNKDNISFTKEMSHSIDEVKPAHLDYGYIINQISELILKLKTYSFRVPYKICNTFSTVDKKGLLVKSNINIKEKSYIFDVLYPVTNTFVTSTISTEEERMNVTLTEEYRNNDVLYRRVGDFNVGEGEI